jgi:integrase
MKKKKETLEAKRFTPLSREQVQKMLKTAWVKTPHYYPLFLCAVRTGIRQGELISLKVKDVDLVEKQINVRRNLSHGEITETKSGKDRKVDVSDQLAKVLDEMLSRRRSEMLQAEMEKPADERRDRATVEDEILESWLFITP